MVLVLSVASLSASNVHDEPAESFYETQVLNFNRIPPRSCGLLTIHVCLFRNVSVGGEYKNTHRYGYTAFWWPLPVYKGLTSLNSNNIQAILT